MFPAARRVPSHCICAGPIRSDEPVGHETACPLSLRYDLSAVENRGAVAGFRSLSCVTVRGDSPSHSALFQVSAETIVTIRPTN